MSSVNEEKFEKVIASFQSTFSILPGGGASIGEGELISSGISQLENFDSYYNQQLSSQSDGQTEEEKDITEAYEQQELENTPNKNITTPSSIPAKEAISNSSTYHP